MLCKTAAQFQSHLKKKYLETRYLSTSKIVLLFIKIDLKYFNDRVQLYMILEDGLKPISFQKTKNVTGKQLRVKYYL